MTNYEKFKEVFGENPDISICPFTSCKHDSGVDCETCSKDWWFSSYKIPIDNLAVDWSIRADYVNIMAKECCMEPIDWLERYHPEWKEVLVEDMRIPGYVIINKEAAKNWLKKQEVKTPNRRRDVDWNARVDYILERAHEKNVAAIYWVYAYHPKWLEVLIPTKDGGFQINYGALEQWLEGGEFE